MLLHGTVRPFACRLDILPEETAALGLFVRSDRTTMRLMDDESLRKLRALCLALPDAREVAAWGAPTFRVKTIFAMYSDGAEHAPPRRAAWIKALSINQEIVLRSDPDRFFVPPYVGPKGWIGADLDHPETDWDELKVLLWDAWTMSVPKSLAKRHPDPPPGW